MNEHIPPMTIRECMEAEESSEQLKDIPITVDKFSHCFVVQERWLKSDVWYDHPHAMAFEYAASAKAWAAKESSVHSAYCYRVIERLEREFP